MICESHQSGMDFLGKQTENGLLMSFSILTEQSDTELSDTVFFQN